MAGIQTCFRRLKPYVGFLKWCVARALLGYLYNEMIYRNRDVLGQITLWTETDKYELGEQMLSKKLGVKLTQSTQKQADYINVPVAGPFKPDYYRY